MIRQFFVIVTRMANETNQSERNKIRKGEWARVGVAMRNGLPRGRGAGSNESGRFETERRGAFDDGWGSQDAGDGLPGSECRADAIRTEIREDKSRTIIATNRSPDVPFDRSINPYRGCEHGCPYCFARPSHAFLGHSPGLEFESILYTKRDAARLLETALRRKNYRPQPIALGSNTDPYQPIEETLRLTRSILEVLQAYGHPVTIVTKSARVARDVDILAPMAREGLARVALSITTLDRKLARTMEPRASTPQRRLEAVEILSTAGVPVRVMVAPVIPALNDHEIEAILDLAAQRGALSADYVLLRMPLEIKTLFREWLEQAVPDRADRVIALMRQMRGGRDYDPEWRTRMTGTGPLAALIAERFKKAKARLGLTGAFEPADLTRFKVPPRRLFGAGPEEEPAGAQLSLF